jgi:diguanylate cyclase (GGDEF)-like protein
MTAESLRAEAPPGMLALGSSRRLGAWVVVQVVAATIALLAVATTASVDPTIALDWPGLRPEVATTAGLTFWLAFGLIGGVRTRLQPGGGVVTFSMPFIVAGTVLGGPLVGGLMGLVSELEVRELRTQPWYGVLANHAVGILGAITAGIVALLLRAPLERLLPDQPGLAFFVVVAVAALVFTTLNVALVVPTLAIRNDLLLGEASRSPDAAFRATTVAEAILAWNLAVAYQSVGWWAPIAIVALVLAVWQAFDRGQRLVHDPLTGLLNDLGFAPRLEAAIGTAKRGGRPAAFLALDLDGLWQVNARHGSAAGDEFLRVSAQRMFRAVRATDSVSRKASTGDEFAILLDDIADIESARLVAERIQAAVRRPIVLRGDAGETIQGGVSIGVVLLERGTRLTTVELAELAERRLEDSKTRGGEIVCGGEGPSEAATHAYIHRKAEARGDSRPDGGGAAGPP